MTDLEMVLAIEHDLARTPARYLEAVAWWNETYSRRIYRKKLADGLRERRRRGEKLQRTRDSWRAENRVWWSFLVRVREAMDTFPNDPARWRQLSRRDAPRILLITVLVTRPDFDAEAVGLDEQTPWILESSARSDCFGRSWAAGGCFNHWNEGANDRNHGLWFKLARAAWKIMQATMGSAPPAQDPQSPLVTGAMSGNAAEGMPSPPQQHATDGLMPTQAQWLRPAEAIAMLRIGDKTDRERRHVFDRLREAMPDEAKRLVGRVQQVEIGAWRAICKALQSRSTMTDDWSGAVDDLVEIEARKAAERQKKERH